jgi:hypothetical protein
MLLLTGPNFPSRPNYPRYNGPIFSYRPISFSSHPSLPKAPAGPSAAGLPEVGRPRNFRAGGGGLAGGDVTSRHTASSTGTLEEG